MLASSVVSGRVSTISMPSTVGAVSIGSRRSSTKVSTSSLPSSVLTVGVLNDLAVVDDGDVAAQLLGFLEVVGGQDDGGAGGVDVAK
jgi:hypothetical protein